MIKRNISKQYRPLVLIGPVSFKVIFVLLVFSLSLLYLFQSNRLAVKGYEMSRLKKEQEKLLEEREKLQVESARLRSLQEIKKGISDSKMIPTKQVNYLIYQPNIAQR